MNRLKFLLVLFATLVWTQPVSAVDTSGPFASAAIDRTLYREGEVRRLHGSFAAWTLVCDEVTRLHLRFCSLRTLVRDASGAGIAVLTVSTGEDGRPAALLKIPVGMGPKQLVDIVLSAPVTGDNRAALRPATRPDRGLRLRPAACDALACTVVWSLPPLHIHALNGAMGFQVGYPGLSNPEGPASLIFLGQAATREIQGWVDARGFAAAVDASINGIK